jgi:hypothetical protein
MHLLEHWKAIRFISDRKLPLGGTALKSSVPNRALSESGFAHDTPATTGDRSLMVIVGLTRSKRYMG